jgi:cytoskeletal protein RodZ
MKTLGEILRKERERKKITLIQASERTRIQTKYLRALENNDYSVFSGKVHSKGFLKIYAQFLGLDIGEILALWRREYEKDLEKEENTRFFGVKELETAKIIVTPGTLLVTFAVVAVIFFFGYLFYQYRSFTGAPNLEIYHPAGDVAVSSDILDITGKTDLDSQVFINNQEIIPGPDGSFAQSIKLKEGLNTISISAVNKLSKRTEIVRTIIYRPEPELEEAKEATESTEEVEFDMESEDLGDVDNDESSNVDEDLGASDNIGAEE